MTTGFGTGFGNPNPAPAFGGGTGFGFGTGTSTGSTGFSFGLGATTTAQNTGFSFGTPATATAPSTGFTFGAPTTTTAPTFSFGNIGTTTTAPTFNFGTFGGAAPTQTTTAPGFSFGQPTGAFSGTSTLGATPAAAGSAISSNAIYNATNNPLIYSDERDAILGQWNQLQACWGFGKGFYTPNAPPVEFTPENPFCRFKAVGYSCMPTAKSEDGLVSLISSKKEEELRPQQLQIMEHMHRVFGSKPNISVVVDSLKIFPEDKTEIVIYLVERLSAGTTHRIVPTEVCAYLEQPAVKPQLASLGIINVFPKTGLSKEQMQQYLQNPPAGIDPYVWQQARLDNPDPEKLIPVPLVGFADLHRRMKCQEYETNQHQERLDIISEDIAELNRKHTTTAAKIAENKRRLVDLQHRVLKTLVLQEVQRKMGFSIQADEEQLRIKLEAIQAELSAPTQFKGHLKELISQIRMQNSQGLHNGDGERYLMDELSKENLKEHLRLQQEGITHLITIIKEDLMDLKTIEDLSKEAADIKR